MKAFRLQIECENSAFGDNEPDLCAAEIAAILRQVAERVERGECNDYDKYNNLRDSNGNPVGTFRLKDE